MVLIASEQKLLMMRPYQIYAVKAIVDCIHQSCGNGYIWHTTGSGKTLTSFKASTLLKDNPDIETTIQKLGLALDENSKRNKQQKRDGKSTYKEQLAPHRNPRLHPGAQEVQEAG